MTAWALKWRSENRIDGKTEHLIGIFHPGFSCPDSLSGYGVATFKTRELARKFKREHYDYIGQRPDLRREPHGWKPPKVVKVEITVVDQKRKAAAGDVEEEKT